MQKMKIIIEEATIQEAILLFLKQNGLAEQFKATDVKFTSTRSPSGTEAEITLERVDAAATSKATQETKVDSADEPKEPVTTETPSEEPETEESVATAEPAEDEPVRPKRKLGQRKKRVFGAAEDDEETEADAE